MMSRWGSTDEQLLGRLLAPPALDDGVESLAFWSRRSRRLPWYRFRARREAVRMTVLWEQRVGAALVSHRASLEARILAGGLIARTRFARWARRAGIVVVAAVTAVVVLGAISVVAVLVPLLNAL